MKKNQIYDILIIGAGPAGLTAGIYAARARFMTLILEKEEIGGQIRITDEVVNYPGIKRTSGKTLTAEMKKQAESFGAEILTEEVEEVELNGEVKKITTKNGVYETFSVILATGARPRTLGFPGEKEYMGRGIAYCATCDGEFFTGKDVFVVGAGYAAAEEAVFLTKYARKVIIIAREPEFTCAKSLAEKALNHKKIEVKFHTEVVEVGGNMHLQYALFRNNQTNEEWKFSAKEGETFGMFIFVGYAPASEIVKNKVKLDAQGYIETDENLKTNIEGVYAAGDITIKHLRQVVTAVSDGAKAATALEQYVQNLQNKYKIIREEKEFKKLERESEQIEEISKNSSEGFFSQEIREQLKPILDKFERKVEVVGIIEDKKKISKEIKSFLEELRTLNEKIEVSIYDKDDKHEWKEYVSLYPSILLTNEKKEYTGVQFHGVPGGHEFNSFIMALYHIAGSGKPLSDNLIGKIKTIPKNTKLKIAVSLSCTMCPDVVMGCQRIALENKGVDAQMIDIAHFPEMKEKYGIMSVPCLIVNDKEVIFGKKSLEELTDILLKPLIP